MNMNKYISLLFTIVVLISCGGSDGDDSQTPPPTGGNDDEPTIPAPSAATLVFPENDSECNTGVIDPENETLSTVTFEWNASENTDSYTVVVTNLNTTSSTFANSTTNSADVKILRGTPYSWFVTSRAQGTTDTSNSITFRFYNEGPGIENYAPFPADAVSPTRGQNLSGISSVNLQWSGSDIDDDISDYEVFFGTNQDSLSSIGNTVNTTITNVTVITGNIYYWQVVTTDGVGNTSTSEVFQFRVY